MIKTFDNFGEVENVWSKSVEESQTATFFQTFEWQKNWWDHFGKGKLWLLEIKEGEELIGLASFEERDGILNFLGTNKVLDGELVTDYGDIVAKQGKEEECWGQILGFFEIPKDLHFLREESPSLEVLRSFNGKIEVEDVAPYLELPATWEEYLASLSRKSRHELRRKMRKFENVGLSRTCLSQNYHGDVAEFFTLFKQTSGEKREFLTTQMGEFFKSLGEIFIPKNMLKLCFLELNGRRLAATISFVFKNETLLYNSGFDREFTPLVPGLILKALLIKSSIEERRKRFDFLRGQERYKYDLGAKDQKLYRVKL